MTKIIIATQNPGKIVELQTLLQDLPFEVVMPESDLDVEETGETYEENAMLKARAYSELFPDALVLADDSGLEVDALEGRPGVYSKRYGSTDEERNLRLLSELAETTDEQRTARFISVMAIVGPNIDQVFRGTAEGAIARVIRGQGGFGYDPVFMPVGYEMTFAELGPDVKNTVGHRALAMKKVKKYLQTIM